MSAHFMHISLTAVLLGLGLFGSPALAQTTSYNQSQSNHTFTSKHGSFEFTGKALKREGDYVSFRASDRTEIWLPVKYLSSESVDYLKYLSGEGPAPTGVTDSPMNPSSIGSTTGPTTGGPASGEMANKPDDSSSSTPPGDETKTPMDTKPADPGKGDPDKIYAPGTAIDVLVDSEWFPGKVFARRPADNAYFVSYSVNGRPKSAWIPAVEIRPQGEEQPMSGEPMEDSSDDDDMASDDLSSFDFKNVKITAKDPIGYEVGPMNKGDILKLRYVSGKWKTWGGLATASPDDKTPAGGDKCRMGICAVHDNGDLQKLTLVPGETVSNPFSWTADRTFEKIILQVNDDDGDFASNPERDVTYAIAIERTASS
ncbi:hypothetical protein [Bremerella alba]|uniref:Uncharacterized protein n=1 Tax=Bremerella alba TaxID=980252 RepID=A0A7V8V4Z6_9BACT|nr:hypothetical protein [Bremerella alba]MBA2115039.1 hypothetical protein [Bremerella alba]